MALCGVLYTLARSTHGRGEGCSRPRGGGGFVSHSVAKGSLGPGVCEGSRGGRAMAAGSLSSHLSPIPS